VVQSVRIETSCDAAVVPPSNSPMADANSTLAPDGKIRVSPT